MTKGNIKDVADFCQDMKDDINARADRMSEKVRTLQNQMTAIQSASRPIGVSRELLVRIPNFEAQLRQLETNLAGLHIQEQHPPSDADLRRAPARAVEDDQLRYGPETVVSG